MCVCVCRCCECVCHVTSVCGCHGAGAVLTEEEIEALKGKLARVTTTLQDREKAKLKETKVRLADLIWSLDTVSLYTAMFEGMSECIELCTMDHTITLVWCKDSLFGVWII